MATKVQKAKAKELKISNEIARLTAIFNDLDENKKKLVAPLIEKAAFMSIELDGLQETIARKGWVSTYKNGENQFGSKKSPEADIYTATMKNYTSVVKQLLDLVPAVKKKSKLAALREE